MLLSYENCLDALKFKILNLISYGMVLVDRYLFVSLSLIRLLLSLGTERSNLYCIIELVSLTSLNLFQDPSILCVHVQSDQSNYILLQFNLTNCIHVSDNLQTASFQQTPNYDLNC